MHAHPTRTLLILLAALLVVVAAVYALRLSFPALAQGPQPQTSAPTGFPSSAPAPKPQDYVAVQHGFQYLVQYTDTWFHPSSLTLKKGETVRFTNNSNAPLHLSLSGAPAPAPALAHGAYFEYTFNTTGTTNVTDGAGHTLAVTVN